MYNNYATLNSFFSSQIKFIPTMKKITRNDYSDWLENSNITKVPILGI